MRGATRLTLLTRAYCHLCDTMRDALLPLAVAHGAKVQEFDVDADPALEAAYGELVPVLFQGDPDDGDRTLPLPSGSRAHHRGIG